MKLHESLPQVSLPNSPGCGIGVERPHLLAGVRVEGADVARRIVAVHEPIADAVAEDHEILVDDRRRRVRVVLLVDLPDQPLAQIDDAVRAERCRPAGRSPRRGRSGGSGC